MIHLEREDHVAILRMDHGPGNLVEPVFLDEFNQRLDEIEASDARALVITGNQDVFVAGGNVANIAEGGADYIRLLHKAVRAFNLRLFTYPMPVVGAVNGNAVSDGLSIAACCDYRIGAKNKAHIGVQALPFQVPFPVTSLEVARFAVPDPWLQNMLYTGALTLPSAAKAFGFFNEMTAPSKVLERAVPRAAAMGAFPPDAFLVTKRQLRQDTLDRIDRLSAQLSSRITEIWTRKETLDALIAFWNQIRAAS